MSNPSPAPDAFQRALTVTSHITAPRLAFRQFYDRYLDDRSLELELSSPPRSFLHAVFIAGQRRSAGDANQTPVAAALALTALGSDEAMARAAACAVAAGLFDPRPAPPSEVAARRAEMSALITTAFGAESAHAILHKAGLQKQTTEDLTFTDPDRLLPAILLARQRLCQVLATDQSGVPVKGTGFLIGPSAVLTNWHVVEGVEQGSIRAVFDFSQSSGLAANGQTLEVEDDILAHSETGPTTPVGASDGWWMDSVQRTGWSTGLADHLDFAVLRLRGAPGLQRGWYNFSEIASAHLSGTCYVFHHPLGNGRSITAGEFKLETPRLSERVFHTASTFKGSSGGLVINDMGVPVALHYLGLGREPGGGLQAPAIPEEVVNVAIPLATIAGKLNGALDKIKAFPGLILPHGCLGQGHPVFGRKNLLERLVPLAKGEKKVLWVKPPLGDHHVKPGKSFTVDIIQAFFPPPQNLYVKVSADQVKAGAKAMAEMIIGALSANASRELPDPETTSSAYAQVLVGSMREIIASRWPGSRIWLVIDDLDVHDLTDGGGRELLNALYRRVSEIPQLRIVLIGLKVQLDSIPEDALTTSEILESDFADIATLFEEWLIERGARDKPIDEKFRSILAKTLASYSGSRAPLAALSKFTIDHLDGPLRGYFGH